VQRQGLVLLVSAVTVMVGDGGSSVGGLIGDGKVSV